jgi:hypothetical protein
MNAAEYQEGEVLGYYDRECRGVPDSEPLAGLSLNIFRAARSRLLAKGQLACTSAGRYEPVLQTEVCA